MGKKKHPARLSHFSLSQHRDPGAQRRQSAIYDLHIAGESHIPQIQHAAVEPRASPQRSKVAELHPERLNF